MADYFTQETTGFTLKPVVKPSGAGFGARMRRYRGIFNLSNQALTTADNIYLGRIPAGAVFAFGTLNTNISLGTASINIGLSKTHAANTQYATGLILTAINTPLLFGMVVDPGSSLPASFTTLPYGGVATWGVSEPSILPQRDLYMTFGVANMPTTNNVVSCDMFFSCE